MEYLMEIHIKILILQADLEFQNMINKILKIIILCFYKI